MTKDEWLAIVQEMRARWPHAEIPKATLAVWFMDVQDLDFERVRETLRELGRAGREFPPTGGVLRARSLEALDVEGGLTEIEAAEVERRVGEIMASYKRNVSRRRCSAGASSTPRASAGRWRGRSRASASGSSRW